MCRGTKVSTFLFLFFFLFLINIDHSEKIYTTDCGISSWLFLLLVIRLTISNATSAKPVIGLWTRRFIAMVLIARYIVEVSFAIQQNSIARLFFFFFFLLFLSLSRSSSICVYSKLISVILLSSWPSFCNALSFLVTILYVNWFRDPW